MKVIDGRVHITWHGYLPIDMKVCIHIAIERYIEITTSTKIEEVPIVTETLPKTSEETLEVIENLKDEFENYIPLYEIRNRLKHLTRFEQDEAIYSLMRKDIIELSKLNEPWLYSDEQCAAGIPLESRRTFLSLPSPPKPCMRLSPHTATQCVYRLHRDLLPRTTGTSSTQM